jgi:hypothetical protein
MAQIDIKNAYVKILDGGANSITIKIGEGNVTWSEKRNMEYVLDRGTISNVKEGDEVPVELNMDFTWEWIKSQGAEDVTPNEAFKNSGAASGWASSGDDACEPYAVDIVIEYQPDCGTTVGEKITFSEFRYESLDWDLRAGTCSVSGKCNEVMPTTVRAAIT